MRETVSSENLREQNCKERAGRQRHKTNPRIRLAQRRTSSFGRRARMARRRCTVRFEQPTRHNSLVKEIKEQRAYLQRMIQSMFIIKAFQISFMSPGTKKDRRYPRIATPHGVWVAWHDSRNQRNVSRVRDLNVGGMFIVTPTPMLIGASIAVLMSVPEGEIRSTALVRNMVPNEGMGVQLIETSRRTRSASKILSPACCAAIQPNNSELVIFPK